jgi:hypothetical protein
MNTRRNKARDGTEVGGWLHLAATPVFTAMALITGPMNADPAHMLCHAMGHASLSSGSMSFMYLLMAVLHAAPWWKRAALLARTRPWANRGSDEP